MGERELVTVQEAAREAGVATSGLLRLIDEGQLEGFRRDREVVVDRAAAVAAARAAGLSPRPVVGRG